MKKEFLLALLFSLIYFFLAFLTLKSYNISWDEPTHFKRGQAYLRYFLTGQKTYEGLPKYNLEEARKNSKYHERSIYQEEGFDANYHLQKDGDHPPLNDILSSLTNYIFYQKLGVIGDVESYHLFEIFISAILVGVVFVFAYEAWGLWAGAFSALFLATYPLFWSESHFNIKDPVEAAFFTLTIYFIWKSILKKNTFFLIGAAICGGLALATKLNIAFLPFIIIPWISYLVFRSKKIRVFVLQKKFILLFVAIPIVAYSIFVLTWPWLWSDIVGNTLKVLSYYKGIGTEAGFSPIDPSGGWNLYATKWVIYTTPPLLLISFLFTVIFWKKINNGNHTLVLLYLWFFVTVLRVSFPGTSIYGGIRQIVEYLPAMAMIGGALFGYLVGRLGKNLRPFVFMAVLISLIIPLINLHPNENVYFNSFIGGVSGAVKTGLPSAGFSFGNAYLQGLTWINQNVEHEAKLALVQGTVLNIPAYKIRPDINYSNAHWSGIGREGEYLIDLTYNYELKVFHYAWEYVEKVLDPVYEINAGGTPILKIWKNDLLHTKPEYRKEEKLFLGVKKLEIKDNSLSIAIPNSVLLSRLVVNFNSNESCDYRNLGYIETSTDGVNWTVEKDITGEEQISGIKGVNEDRLVFFFAAKEAKFVKIPTFNKNSCLFKNPTVNLYSLN